MDLTKFTEEDIADINVILPDGSEHWKCAIYDPDSNTNKVSRACLKALGLPDGSSTTELRFRFKPSNERFRLPCSIEEGDFEVIISGGFMFNVRMNPRFKEPRNANQLDVPRITEILLAALASDPFYSYLWQRRREFPDDHHFYWSNRIYGDLFNPRYKVLVLELADGAGERVGKSQTIAFAIWERKGHSDSAIKWERERRVQTAANHAISVLSAEQLLREFPGSRRDVSTARQEACSASLLRADETFDNISRDRLQLEFLCTDPDFQRRGAGLKLVQWGVDKAITEEAKVISVTASLQGQTLYREHKFIIVGRETIQVEGEEVINYTIMIRWL
ncbi:MAG: hypothetical protein M1839_007417 [Geoglossum umbratile]|nr:MAG: hypothetical protein M1839_007417 [Geoglossum umbratile]